MRPTWTGRIWPGVGTGVAAVAVWILTAELAWPARLLSAALLSALPALVLAQGRVADEIPEEVSRGTLYLSSSVALWILAGVTLLAAQASGITPVALGIRWIPAPSLAFWTAATIAAGLLLLVVGRALRLPETPLLVYLLPRTRAERLQFAATSLSAGVCEELVFRGFLITVLATGFGSVAAATVVSSLVFGLLHAYQGGVGVARAAVLGGLLAAPLLATGSLLPSVLAHTALNLITGIGLADWLLRR